jgi:hypothetical protein
MMGTTTYVKEKKIVIGISEIYAFKVATLKGNGDLAMGPVTLTFRQLI